MMRRAQRGGAVRSRQSKLLEYTARVPCEMVLIIFFLFIIYIEDNWQFCLSQNGRSNRLIFSTHVARLVMSFWQFCHISKSRECFSSRKMSAFSSLPHLRRPAVTRLIPTDHLDKLWQQIKGKTPLTPAPSACQHISCQLPQAGMSNHRHVSALATPDSCMNLLWNLSRKKSRNYRLNFCPHCTDFIRKSTWKNLPSPRSICTQRQQLSLKPGNQSMDYWISKLTTGYPSPPAYSSPAFLGFPTFPLTASTWMP